MIKHVFTIKLIIKKFLRLNDRIQNSSDIYRIWHFNVYLMYDLTCITFTNYVIKK